MKYIFKEEEFVTLLAISGIKRLYSFELKNIPDDSAIVSSVHSLYKSGFVVEENGKMMPEAELAEIIEKISTDTHVIKVSLPAESAPLRLVYLSDVCELVVIERRISSRENVLKVEKIHIDDFINDVIVNEISEYVSLGSKPDEELIEKMRQLDLHEDKSVQTVFCAERILCSSGKTESITKVNITALFPRIISEDEDGIRNELYTEEKMRQLLFKTVGRK